MPSPSGTTPAYAFPYLLESDVPDVATASEDLATAIENNLLARRGQLLGSIGYNPSTVTNYSVTSTTLAAIDATNLVVPFIVGPTGNVLVRCSGPVAQPASSGGGALGVLIGGTAYTRLDASVPRTPWGFDLHVAGLTAGASLTAELGGLCTPTVAYPLQVGVGGATFEGQIVMEVWSA